MILAIPMISQEPSFMALKFVKNQTMKKSVLFLFLMAMFSVSIFSQTKAPFFSQVSTRVKSSVTWYYGTALELKGGLGSLGGSIGTLYVGLKELGSFGVGTSLVELLDFQNRVSEWSFLPLYLYYPIAKGKPTNDVSKRIPWLISVYTGGALFAVNPDKVDDAARSYFKLGILGCTDFLKKKLSANLNTGLMVGKTYGKGTYASLFLILSLGIPW